MCRSYTPELAELNKRLANTKEAYDGPVYFAEFHRFFSLMLAEDGAIERTTPPAVLAAPIARAIRILRKVDADLRVGEAAAVARNNTTAITMVVRLARLSDEINPVLDGAGLRDCGSNQS
jgi:hypothetical protein